MLHEFEYQHFPTTYTKLVLVVKSNCVLKALAIEGIVHMSRPFVQNIPWNILADSYCFVLFLFFRYVYYQLSMDLYDPLFTYESFAVASLAFGQ